MSPTLERSIWVSLAVLGALALIAFLTLTRLGGRVPALKPLGSTTNGYATDWSILRNAAPWFEPAPMTRLTAQTNLPNPFFTTHFQPPPPPSTKPVELTYLGFVASEGRPRRALVQVDKTNHLFTPGAMVIAGHAVKDIARRTLILTNAAAVTNVLEFRIKKVLEIPAH